MTLTREEVGREHCNNTGKALQTLADHVSELTNQVWERTFENQSGDDTSRDDYLFTIGMGMFEAEVKKMVAKPVFLDTEFLDTLDSLQYMTEWLDRWIAYLKDEKYESLVQSLRDLKGECLDLSVDLVAAWLAAGNSMKPKAFTSHHCDSKLFAQTR